MSTQDEQAPEPEVLVSVRGRLGRIELNRPGAINALSLPMVRLIDAALDELEADPVVATVVLTGRGERGFCAGGDVRAFHRSALDDGGASALGFLTEEYALDARIARFPKPVVAIMSGVTLGGGMGLGGHAAHRVVTETSKLGFPEVGIGFLPDVGGTWLLSRRRDESGTMLALTGRAVGAADAIAAGLADHLVPSGAVDSLLTALETQEPAAALAAHAVPSPGPELLADSAWIGHCFAPDTVGEILAALHAAPEPAAAGVAELIEQKSPTSLVVTLAALRRARRLPDLEAALAQERRAAEAFVRSEDFVEGIRAQVIDKDRAPRWNPSTIDEVAPERVAAFFD